LIGIVFAFDRFGVNVLFVCNVCPAILTNITKFTVGADLYLILVYGPNLAEAFISDGFC
jgi:hypothetical protein